MARSPFAVALGATAVAALVIFQLCYFLGLPATDFWRWHPAAGDDDARVSGWGASALQRPLADGVEDRADTGDEYLIGVGKADITGPVVELNLMGYADPAQVGTGLRQRLYSRAFIVADPANAADRWVYLVLDTQSGDTAVRDGIMRGLATMGSEYSAYSQDNVAVTGTHSHAGPGAWLNYLLPQVTSLGFNKQSYRAIVDGALLSIQRAHESLEPGRLAVGSTNVTGANINRSLYAYLNNPEEERARYDDNVDKALTLLRFRRSSDGKDVGVLSWFAVHGTSLFQNNTLVAGDNKGVSAWLFERAAGTGDVASAVDDGSFVAAFSQANVGDTTPNVQGAYCETGDMAGQMCRFNDSTCDGRTQGCHGRGPYWGLDDAGTRSCREIGQRQYDGARSLYDAMADEAGSTPVAGATVHAEHIFRDLDGFEFTHPNGSLVRTCSAALGYSFAAGTSDGPGAFDFTQGDEGEGDNPLWSVVGGLVHAPSAEQRACQAPKPILLDAGATTVPYQWAPSIVDVQVLRVGQLLIVVSPGEATTMSGRRWREAVAAEATASGLLSDGDGGDSDDAGAAPAPVVVLGGPANSYTHYIATEEEYAIQRYEGASTLYGPHTLNAYINLTLGVLPYLAARPPTVRLDPGPYPPINTNDSLSFITPVVYDSAGIGRAYGDVVADVEPEYPPGATPNVTFVGANPRNDLRLEGTFAALERRGDDGGGWTRVLSDFDWELVYRWRRTNEVLGTSEVDIWWENAAGEGTYRFRYYGDAKGALGGVEAFEGMSGEFFIQG
ncbi:neutral ceramidase precursor [Lineolata rhizophorae]|uniref:Neutral ceramidase n=1 Tax=Lineolata rhizophorae TaxID=578093 RepID=A0A6A6P489_9PEZI|nr:neutral ceramidase precursor [Lineolata rhizophorae]